MKLKCTLLTSALLLPLMASGMTLAAEPTPARSMKASSAGMDCPHERGILPRRSAKLPKSVMKVLHEEMQKTHEANKSTIEATMTVRKEMQALLAAPTFDRDAFLKKNAELQNLKDLLAQAKANTMAAAAEKLSAEDRKAWAESFPPFTMGPPHHDGMMMRHRLHPAGKGAMDRQAPIHGGPEGPGAMGED